MEILFPGKLRSDQEADTRQRKGTTARAKNVRLLDAASMRSCGAQRSGQTRVAPNVLNGANKVTHLAEVVYESPTHSYTALGAASTVDYNLTLPNSSDCYAIVTDAQGSYYALDGATGIVKFNAGGQKQWKISLPATERASIVRALAVDDSLRVYAAVSSGGDPTKAKVWCYEQLADNKTELLWELTPGWFTESLWVEGLTLFAGQNDSTLWRSRIAHYTGIGLRNPTESKSFEVPYPINFASTSPLDGSIFISHEPNANRGNTPRSPQTTGRSEDATLRDIFSNYASRARCWHSTMDVDGDDTNNSAYESGAIIDTIVDKTGNQRNWYATITGKVGATLRKGSVAGRDALFFNGVDSAYEGEAALSTAFEYRELNGSIMPAHAKHQTVMFQVWRLPQESTLRSLFGRCPVNATAGYDLEQIIYANGTFNGAASVAAPGNILLYEESGGASGASGRASGANSTSLPGPFDSDGLVLITWVFDHGYDDVTGTASRSQLRINGRPVDRWTSFTGFQTLVQCTLGIAMYPSGAFTGANALGDLLEFFVLEDSYDTAFGATTALTQRRLIESPTYPDVVWAANGDTELERAEGFFAHRCGMAHKLPTGNFAALDALAVGNVNDTITIDGHVYTLKAAPTTVADEVRIGATAFLTLVNLHHAINGSGVAGTDYGSATVRHASVWSPGVVENGNTAARPDMLIQRRDARIATTFATTESTAGVRFAWLNGATSVTSRNGSGRNVGHYPHSFFLYKTAQSAGGPPRTAGVLTPSVPGALISPYGMLSKWDPANGKVRNVFTTDGPGTAALGFGGIGYGHTILSDGSIVTVGPRQAAVTSLSITADSVDVRKVTDINNVFGTVNGATAITAWTSAPGALIYQWPRLAVDKWDNAYVPIFQASNGTSAAVYKKVAASAAMDAALLYTVTSITDDPKAHAIAIDPLYPDLLPAFTDPRAARFYLATRKEAAGTLSIYCVRQIAVAATNTVPRAIHRVAISGGNLYKVNVGGAATLVASAFLDANSRYVASATLKGVLYIVDGANYKLYDAKLGINGGWRALRGEIPQGAMLIERYGQRLFLAGFRDNRYALAACQYGDAYGWDFNPPGDSPLATAAIHSDTAGGPMGDFGDVITGLFSYKDDLMVVTGEHSMAIMRGDPAQGGRFDELVKGIGAAFGRAGCFLPDGRFLWVTNQGELYGMRVSASGNSEPELLSARVSVEFKTDLDFSLARVELHYDPQRRSVKIVQIPHGATSTAIRHWELELETMGLVPDTYGAAEVCPTAALLVDGDTPAARQFWIGGGDGRVRFIDPSAVDDDGTRIDSEVLLHMPEGDEEPVEAMFDNLDVMLDPAAGGARYEFQGSPSRADVLTTLVSGLLTPGRNRPGAVRVSTGWGGLLIAGRTATHERWALQRVTMDVSAETEQVR